MKKNYTLSLDIEPILILREDGLNLSQTINSLIRGFITQRKEINLQKSQEVFKEMEANHGNKTPSQIQTIIDLLINGEDTPQSNERMRALRQLLDAKKADESN